MPIKIITLCGSTKFKKEWEKTAKTLIEQGFFVRSIEVFGYADNITFTHDYKDYLEQIHFEKIDLSDAIFVINKNGYIGKSTSKEIRYAKSKNKEILFLEHPQEIEKNGFSFKLDVELPELKFDEIMNCQLCHRKMTKEGKGFCCFFCGYWIRS